MNAGKPHLHKAVSKLITLLGWFRQARLALCERAKTTASIKQESSRTAQNAEDLPAQDSTSSWDCAPLHSIKLLYKATLGGIYRAIEKNKWPLLRIYQRKP